MFLSDFHCAHLLYFTRTVIVVSIIIEQDGMDRDQNKTPVGICKY